MKGLRSKLFFVLFSFFHFSFSQNPKWVNFTYGNDVYAIAIEGNYVWVGTNGEVIRFDRTAGTITFYDKANSGLPSNYVRS
ncbi:MAG: hypothetical protein ABDI07_12235, partial [Candidatus Kryptonium sp.]